MKSVLSLSISNSIRRGLADEEPPFIARSAAPERQAQGSSLTSAHTSPDCHGPGGFVRVFGSALPVRQCAGHFVMASAQGPSTTSPGQPSVIGKSDEPPFRGAGLRSRNLRIFPVELDGISYPVVFHLRSYHRTQHRPNERPLRPSIELLLAPPSTSSPGTPGTPGTPGSALSLPLFDVLSTHVAEAAAPPTDNPNTVYFHAKTEGIRGEIVEQLVRAGALRVERPFMSSGAAVEKFAVLELLLRHRDLSGPQEILVTVACAHCGCVPRPPAWCSKCRASFYCDRNCQKKDFAFHKTICESKPTRQK